MTKSQQVTPYQTARPNQKSDASTLLRELVLRQARAWEQNNLELALDDWHPEGILVSPAGAWKISELAAEMTKLHRDYCDLVIDIKNIFATADGTRLAVEWDWTITRRSDGLTGTTPDAIIAELNSDGRILSWREYFDLSTSVET
ncbi:MAG: nuclear transport factor 2 family protein [Deinococcota bacterium]